MKALDVVELAAVLAVLGIGLYAAGYRAGLQSSRVVEVPVGVMGERLFVQAPAHA